MRLRLICLSAAAGNSQGHPAGQGRDADEGKTNSRSVDLDQRQLEGCRQPEHYKKWLALLVREFGSALGYPDIKWPKRMS